MSFSSQKGEFDRFFNRPDRPVEESRPDRQPDRPFDSTDFHLWPTSSGPNPAPTQKFKPEPGPSPKTNFKPTSCSRKPKVKLGLKNLAMLPNYFGYIFMHLRQKVRLRPKISPKFFSTSGTNPARSRLEPGPNPVRTQSEPQPDPKSPARLTTLLQFMRKAFFIYQNVRTNILRACAKSQLKAAWKHGSLNGSGIKATETAE